MIDPGRPATGRPATRRTSGADQVADRWLVATPSQTIGPYLTIGMRPFERSEVVPPSTAGSISLYGAVRDGDGAPVPDAMVELWQAAPDGRFAATAGADGTEPWFGRSLTDAAGGYRIVTCKPGRLRLPSGALQAPHVELLVFARGLLRPVRTRAYFADEPAANDADPVLGAIEPRRRATLVSKETGEGARFDITLQGAAETVFFSC